PYPRYGGCMQTRDQWASQVAAMSFSPWPASTARATWARTPGSGPRSRPAPSAASRIRARSLSPPPPAKAVSKGPPSSSTPRLCHARGNAVGVEQHGDDHVGAVDGIGHRVGHRGDVGERLGPLASAVPDDQRDVCGSDVAGHPGAHDARPEKSDLHAESLTR